MKKIKQRALSIKRINNFVYGFIKENPKVDMTLLKRFLDYIDKHKYD